MLKKNIMHETKKGKTWNYAEFKCIGIITSLKKISHLSRFCSIFSTKGNSSATQFFRSSLTLLKMSDQRQQNKDFFTGDGVVTIIQLESSNLAGSKGVYSPQLWQATILLNIFWCLPLWSMSENSHGKDIVLYSLAMHSH